MKISKKELEKLNKEGLITSEQVEQIVNYYQSNNDNTKLWKRLFIIAALLIALGIVLVISANWASIPNFIKISIDFILFLALIYADYYFIINNKRNLTEVFLVISFFIIATVWLCFIKLYYILNLVSNHYCFRRINAEKI